MTEIVYAAPDYSISTIDRILDGREFLTLSKPREQTKRLNRIALTRRICTNHYREWPQRQVGLSEALEVAKAE